MFGAGRKGETLSPSIKGAAKGAADRGGAFWSGEKAELEMDSEGMPSVSFPRPHPRAERDVHNPQLLRKGS